MGKNLRMYILINGDIKISKGKLAGQVGHAVSAWMYKNITNKQLLDEYMQNEQKKIILKCPSIKLEELEKEGFVSIRDKGYTELEPNTLTCVNLGVFEKELAPEITKELKLL